MGAITVAFDPEDYFSVSEFVEQIKATKPNIRRTALTAEQREDGEYAGKLGEVAFARAFGGWPVNWVVGVGGDAGDFLLSTGKTVDIKAVSVKSHMGHDYAIPMGPEDRIPDYLVQVLVAPDYAYALVTGWITGEAFVRLSQPETGWGHRGSVTPAVVRRSRLTSQWWPEEFWYRGTV